MIGAQATTRGWTIAATLSLSIHAAAAQGAAGEVRKFLKHGTGVDARTADGRTPLMVAAEEGQVEVARLLVEEKAKVNCRSYEGRSALMLAANRGHLPVVRLLVENGAGVNTTPVKNKNYGRLNTRSAPRSIRFGARLTF